MPELVGYGRHQRDRALAPILGLGSFMRTNGEARMAATRSRVALCTSGCWARLAKQQDASWGSICVPLLLDSKTAGWGLQRVRFVGGITASSDALRRLARLAEAPPA